MPVRVAQERLATVANAVRCFSLAMPPKLKFRNQYLSFDPKLPGQTTSLRKLHSWIYSIHLMSQLTKFMLNHYWVFGVGAVKSKTSSKQHSQYSKQLCGHTNFALSQYFEAADNVLAVVHRSCEEQYQYVNPFLATTIWQAAAVQLVRKEFGPGDTDPALIKSKFEVLCMTYKQFVRYWGTVTALEQNLDTLETELSKFQKPKGDDFKEGHRRRSSSKRSQSHDTSQTIRRPSSANQAPPSQSPSSGVQQASPQDHRTPHSNPDQPLVQQQATPSSITSTPNAVSEIQQLQPEAEAPHQYYAQPVYSYQQYPANQPGLAQSNASPVSSYVSGPRDPNQAVLYGSVTEPMMVPPTDMTMDIDFSNYFGTGNVELSNYLDGLLSGSYVS